MWNMWNILLIQIHSSCNLRLLTTIVVSKKGVDLSGIEPEAAELRSAAEEPSYRPTKRKTGAGIEPAWSPLQRDRITILPPSHSEECAR